MLIGQNNYPRVSLRAQVFEVGRAMTRAQLGKDKACECAETRKTSLWKMTPGGLGTCLENSGTAVMSLGIDTSFFRQIEAGVRQKV